MRRSCAILILVTASSMVASCSSDVSERQLPNGNSGQPSGSPTGVPTTSAAITAITTATPNTTTTTTTIATTTTVEPGVAETAKDCPLRSLTAIDALVAVTPAANTLQPVEPAIGGSVVASVRVDEVLWQMSNVNLHVGDVFDGLVYAHSTTADDWGFDDEWLSGETPLVTGLSRNQIRQVDVPWEFESAFVNNDGSIKSAHR